MSCHQHGGATRRFLACRMFQTLAKLEGPGKKSQAPELGSSIHHPPVSWTKVATETNLARMKAQPPGLGVWCAARAGS